MNERLQELAEQAWAYQMRVYKDNGVRTYGEREQVFSKEKFAELIVRECAELNFRELGLSGSASFDVSRMIKEHFGVEE